ncbi:hypothetical protein HRbin01_01939 [archaeon HR01]|nr:hypothetical protein HRbin01_01939 [archaeon HR01]
MIVRVWRCRISSAEGFREFTDKDALPILRSQEGCIAAYVGLDDLQNGIVVTVWRDLESLRRFAGDDWREPVIHPNEVKLLAEKPKVEHYTLVGML